MIFLIAWQILLLERSKLQLASRPIYVLTLIQYQSYGM